MNNEIIDDFSDLDANNLLDNLAWWEKKRILFNIIIGAANLIPTILYNSFHSTLECAFNTIIWMAVMNICYSTGFMLEALDEYYFKGRIKIARLRMFLFIVGTLFSALVTFGFAASYYLVSTGF